MDIHTIDIPVGYSGTVEVSAGSLKLEFPGAKLECDMRRYNIHLLTPDRKNIEFDLLRMPDGDWCDDICVHPNCLFPVPIDLREAAKKVIIAKKL